MLALWRKVVNQTANNHRSFNSPYIFPSYPPPPPLLLYVFLHFGAHHGWLVRLKHPKLAHNSTAPHPFQLQKHSVGQMGARLCIERLCVSFIMMTRTLACCTLISIKPPSLHVADILLMTQRGKKKSSLSRRDAWRPL